MDRGRAGGAADVDIVVVADGDDFTDLMKGPLRRLFGPRTTRVESAAELRARLDGNARVVVADARARCMDSVEAQALVREIAPEVSFVLIDADRDELRRRIALCEQVVSLGALVAQVTHEINNPLQSAAFNLDFALDVLRGGGDWTAARHVEVVSALEDARTALAQASAIAGDLRTLARCNDGARETLDVRTILDSALLAAAHQTQQRARVIREYRSVPWVSASPGRLRQVFVNLLVNAAQAITKGAAEENAIRVSTSTDARGCAVIAVRDTGCGMTSDVAGKIFHPFFTTKPPGTGTGLGLAICHDIVTALGGAIEVRSEPSRGTEVRIVLPPSSLGTGSEREP